MKINIRHEAASEPDESVEGNTAVATPERACVWIVGDDGESIATEYLKVGEQVSIEVDATVQAGVGIVGPIS